VGGAAEIVMLCSRTPIKQLGRLKYIAGIAAYFHDRPSLNSVFIMNGRSIGGGIKISPWSHVDDGKLELVTVSGATFFDVFFNLH
jgi:hypothetical protein